MKMLRVVMIAVLLLMVGTLAEGQTKVESQYFVVLDGPRTITVVGIGTVTLLRGTRGEVTGLTVTPPTPPATLPTVTLTVNWERGLTAEGLVQGSTTTFKFGKARVITLTDTRVPLTIVSEDRSTD